MFWAFLIKKSCEIEANHLPSSEEDVDILPGERRDKDRDLEVLEALDDFRLTRWFILGDKSAVEEEWLPTGVWALEP